MRNGLVIEIISDRGTNFLNEVIDLLLQEFMFVHNKLAPYHPQDNKQAKSTNKVLKVILIKIVSGSKSDWEIKLQSIIWAYQIAYEIPIGTMPFIMVYALYAILPMDFLIPSMQVA